MITSTRVSSQKASSSAKFLAVLAIVSLLAAWPAVAGGQPGGTQGNPHADDQACWGQATQVFARTGGMGIHASNQSNPRLGLHNLAVLLYDAGLIDAPTLQALGAFVSVDISACS